MLGFLIFVSFCLFFEFFQFFLTLGPIWQEIWKKSITRKNEKTQHLDGCFKSIRSGAILRVSFFYLFFL